MIALTYDDGPEIFWTAKLLKALADADAVATFFVQSRRAASMPEQVEEMRSAGHEIGFHCLDHRRHSEMSDDEIRTDAAIGLDILGSLDIEPRLWRTPWGDVTDTTRRVAEEHGLELCGWSVDTHDWRGDTSQMMLDALISDGGLRRGDIVLMHDGIGPGARRDKSHETIEFTTAIIDSAREQDLEPVVASECLNAGRNGRTT